MTAFISGALGVLGSPFGRIVLAFLVGWVWSGYRTDAAWRERAAAERAAAEAAYRAEVGRQERAAREIGEAATRRVEEDSALAEDLKSQLEKAAKAESHETVKIGGRHCRRISRACVIDRAFADQLRQLDGAGRKGAASRRASHVR